ncbi:MAG: hydroxyacid dehydrogenase [Candidatus Omnitrophica bacterium]|nr:hydroxyacid dehydrogenase [Candidatus Omnitrophota bacterium]
MIDVMFYEMFEEEEREIKRMLPRDIRAGFTPKTIQEAGDTAPPATVVSIRTQSRIPLDWGRRVKGILARTQGYDHLAVYRRESKAGISYGFLGNYCARAVAEQAALMMMALMRNLKKQEKNFVAFSRDGLTGTECKGKRALVVGVGNIGREIVDIGRGLGMEAKGVDIAQTLKKFAYVPLNEGIEWADIIFCALSLTEKTNGMLNYEALNKARTGAIFINIARGEIAPLEDLKRLLDEGKISGIGLDVYAQEGFLADSLRAGKSDETPQGKLVLELAQSDKAVLTPHNAFNTKEALARKAALTVESVVSCLKKGTFPHPVPLL